MGTITRIKFNMPKTADERWAYVSEPWQKQVPAIIETGQRLIVIKESTPHNEWEDTFKGRSFGVRTAQCLMAIANNPVLAKTHHGAFLPPSWRTLYELSRLPEDVLQQKIEKGEVHPELRRSEVEAWIKEAQERDKRLKSFRTLS